jgi:DNA-binding transcriptional ArsR family regulator
MRHRTLTEDAEIAAYLHRTRMEMLDVLRDGPRTLSQIAERLGVHPANLTRHLRTLEAAGLVALVEKRDTGRNLEKYYAAAAETFDIAVGAHELSAPEKIALAFVRSDLSAALARLPDDHPGPVMALVQASRISAAQLPEFLEALSALARRFEAADSPDGHPHHLALALYPAEADVDRTARRIEIADDSRRAT